MIAMGMFGLTVNARRSQSLIATIRHATQRADTQVCPYREGTHKGYPYASHSTKALRSNAYQNSSLFGASANTTGIPSGHAPYRGQIQDLPLRFYLLPATHYPLKTPKRSFQ